MRLEGAFDLRRLDVRPAGDDGLADPADDVDPALVVDVPEIRRPPPAVGQQPLVVLRGRADQLRGDAGGADDQLAVHARFRAVHRPHRRSGSENSTPGTGRPMDVHSSGCDISRRVSNVVDAGASVCPQHWTRASVCSLTASSAGIAAGSPASIRQDSCDPRNRGSYGRGAHPPQHRRHREHPGDRLIRDDAAASRRRRTASRNTFVPPHRRVGSTLQPPAYTRGATCRVLGREGRTAGAHHPGVAEHRRREHRGGRSRSPSASRSSRS